MNNYDVLVSGTDSFGKDFDEKVHFELIPPEEGKSHYGIGYYMKVKIPLNVFPVDVRYEQTTDIKELAKRWIEGYYGANAKSVVPC